MDTGQSLSQHIVRKRRDLEGLLLIFHLLLETEGHSEEAQQVVELSPLSTLLNTYRQGSNAPALQTKLQRKSIHKHLKNMLLSHSGLSHTYRDTVHALFTIDLKYSKTGCKHTPLSALLGNERQLNTIVFSITTGIYDTEQQGRIRVVLT